MAYLGSVIKIPIGVQGFTGTRNPSQAGPGHLTYVDGVEIYGGILRKEGGADRLNPSPVVGGGSIISGISWSPDLGINNDVIFTSTGRVFKDTGDGTFSTMLSQGLTVTRDPPPLFVPAGGEGLGDPRKLFIFSSSNQVKVIEGNSDTLSDIPSPPSDWADGRFPSFGVLHNGRMFAGGNSSDPHRIYYSSISNHGTFSGDESGAGTLPVYPGEGEGLVGGMSFRGALVLWKYPFGIYIIRTDDPSPTNWRTERITTAVGGLNQQSIVQIDNDVLYMDFSGSIHALSATQEFGDISTSNISKAMELEPFMREWINRGLLKRATGIWYASKRQAWFSVSMIDSVENNLRLMLGFDAEQPRIFMSRRDNSPSMWMRPSDIDLAPRPTSGDNEGTVWNLDTDTFSKDGSAYEMRFETANTDFQFADPSMATRMKAGQFIEIVAEPRGSWELTVEVYWDDILSDIIEFNMGVGGAPLDEFVLDNDVLASSIIASQRRPLYGSGRRLRFNVYNGGAGQDISLAELYVSLIPMDERIREGS